MSYRKKGNQPLERQDVIDILLAANSAHYALTHELITAGEPGDRYTLALTPQNFLNELHERLQRAWFDPDPIPIAPNEVTAKSLLRDSESRT